MHSYALHATTRPLAAIASPRVGAFQVALHALRDACCMVACGRFEVALARQRRHSVRLLRESRFERATYTPLRTVGPLLAAPPIKHARHCATPATVQPGAARYRLVQHGASWVAPALVRPAGRHALDYRLLRRNYRDYRLLRGLQGGTHSSSCRARSRCQTLRFTCAPTPRPAGTCTTDRAAGSERSALLRRTATRTIASGAQH